MVNLLGPLTEIRNRAEELALVGRSGIPCCRLELRNLRDVHVSVGYHINLKSLNLGIFHKELIKP